LGDVLVVLASSPGLWRIAPLKPNAPCNVNNIQLIQKARDWLKIITCKTIRYLLFRRISSFRLLSPV